MIFFFLIKIKLGKPFRASSNLSRSIEYSFADTNGKNRETGVKVWRGVQKEEGIAVEVAGEGNSVRVSMWNAWKDDRGACSRWASTQLQV